MEEKANKIKTERNKNLIILLLLLIIVAIAAQTVYMYKMFNSLHEKMLIIVNPTERVCPILKPAPKPVCQVAPKKAPSVQQSKAVSAKGLGKNVNILNAEKILNENAQLVSQGMKENPDSYVCKYKVPGVTKKDISIETNGDYLTIGVQMKKHLQSNDPNNPFNVESYSTVHKSIAIPPKVDKNNISAVFEKGVLTLTFPKVGY